jgi:hypothetical protein
MFHEFHATARGLASLSLIRSLLTGPTRPSWTVRPVPIPWQVTFLLPPASSRSQAQHGLANFTARFRPRCAKSSPLAMNH